MARPSIDDIHFIDGNPNAPNDFDRDLFHYFLDHDFHDFLLQQWFPIEDDQKAEGIKSHVRRVVERLKHDYQRYDRETLLIAFHGTDYAYFPELRDLILINLK